MPVAASAFARFLILALPAFFALAPLPASASSADPPGNAWSRIAAPAPGPPQIYGGVSHGCIAGAAELPPDGPGYEAIRLSRHRNFGHPNLVAYIERLGRRAEAAGLPVFYVGDMAQPRGGPLPSGHASHQTGIDVDIWLDLQPKQWRPPAEREDVALPSMLLANYREIDPKHFGAKQVQLIKLAASDPEVERIFVNPVIKAALCRSARASSPAERAWLGRIRPWFGHDEHFHVRLHCPADSPHCEEQRPVPAGDGCGAELASWLRHLPPPPPENAARRMPVLPAACHGLLKAR
jgi:penicillin-insensitive murein endopeptidase